MDFIRASLTGGIVCQSYVSDSAKTQRLNPM